MQCVLRWRRAQIFYIWHHIAHLILDDVIMGQDMSTMGKPERHQYVLYSTHYNLDTYCYMSGALMRVMFDSASCWATATCLQI